MSTVKPVNTDHDDQRVQTVFADIRETRGSDFINNFWRYLGQHPDVLETTWQEVKNVMAIPSALDSKTKEMLYVAVSVANACSYCIHSHTAAARAQGMTEEEYGELLRIVSLAAKTNHLVTAMQIPVDDAFNADRSPD